jgi:integrase
VRTWSPHGAENFFSLYEGFRISLAYPESGDEGFEQRQKAGLSNAKINRETEILSRAFNLAVEEGRLAQAPKIPALAKKNARKGFFERAEFEAVVRHLPEHLVEVARFGYLTGWRRGEVAALRWENVDRSAGEIRLDTSKNGDGRVQVDGSRVAGLPGGIAPVAFRFPPAGNPPSELQPCLAARLHCCGLPEQTVPRPSPDRVRDMIRGGVSQHVAMAISGHKTASMFQRYNISSTEDKLEALRRRQNYVEARDAGATLALHPSSRGSRAVKG